MSRLALSLAFVRQQRAQVAVLLLMGASLAVSVIGLAAVRDSAQQAVVDSLRADVAHRSWVLQSSDPAAAAALTRMDGVAPVEDDQGEIASTSGELSAAALIRSTTEPGLELGVLTQGRRPTDVGDVLVSETTADALGLQISDPVRVTVDGRPTEGRVVGLSVDPADVTNSTVVRLVSASGDFTPSRWVSDRDFYTGALRPLLDRRTARYQSVDALQEMAELGRPRFLSLLRFLPTGVGLLLAVVLLTVVGGLTRRWRVYADGLISAGMAPAAAWRWLFTTAFVLVILGEIAGSVIVLAALQAFHVPVSAWFGQRWVAVALPVAEPLALVGATLLAVVPAGALVRGGPAWRTWLGRRRPVRRWVTPVVTVAGAVAMVAFGVSLWAAGRAGYDGLLGVTVPLALVIAAALPFALSPLASAGLPPASRAVVGNLLGGLRPVLSAVAVLSLLFGVYTARTTYDANFGEAISSPLEPAGSLVVSEMPDSVIPVLEKIYRAKGGHNLIRYGLPNETESLLRVTTTNRGRCMAAAGVDRLESVPASCSSTRAAVDPNVVGIGAPGSRPRADPALLSGGQVGLLTFAGTPLRATRISEMAAEPDVTLGGNLPGLVVPADSTLLQTLGLAASGTSTVMLLDYATLDPTNQLYVRAATLRLAAGAQIADGTDPTAYDRLRSLANTLGILGAFGAAVLVLLGGLSLVVASSLVRRTLVDLGAAAGVRWQVLGRLLAVLMGTTALVPPLAILTASLGGRAHDASYGWVWSLPGVLSLVASAVVGVAYLQRPDHAEV